MGGGCSLGPERGPREISPQPLGLGLPHPRKERGVWGSRGPHPAAGSEQELSMGVDLGLEPGPQPAPASGLSTRSRPHLGERVFTLTAQRFPGVRVCAATCELL